MRVQQHAPPALHLPAIPLVARASPTLVESSVSMSSGRTPCELGIWRCSMSGSHFSCKRHGMEPGG